MGGEDQANDCAMKEAEEEEEEEEARILEWEVGLPPFEDLMPLSQMLVTPDLASAFSISPEPCRNIVDVTRASHATLSGLRRQTPSLSSNNLKYLPSAGEEAARPDPSVVEAESSGREAPESRKTRRADHSEEAESGLRGCDGLENSTDDNSARTLKRPRLVWTPQLHKRFVDVVAHLGIKNAVPKTIMQLMNVEGLTRENVASHLQKYRLYLKRMHGSANEGPSDQLFASTPVPQSLHEPCGPMQIPMQYGTPLMPMPVLGIGHGHGHVGMPMNNSIATGAYNGYESHSYNMFREPQRDWSGSNLKKQHLVEGTFTQRDKSRCSCSACNPLRGLGHIQRSGESLTKMEKQNV